jgi:prepilin-type N-terminal cleavage/methylation domain-containing protein
MRVLSSSRWGFTLIELLIVVAIIAILAAIAVPNFLEAQVRSKVSRCLADMRSMATGLEAYAVDNNRYITGWAVGDDLYNAGAYGSGPFRMSMRLIPLTTPVAYMTSVPEDPFVDVQTPGFGDTIMLDTFDYWDAQSGVERGDAPTYHENKIFGRDWRLCSAGPDLQQWYGVVHWSDGRPCPYDTSNGTMSFGDIIFLQGSADPGSVMQAGMDWFESNP